MRVHPNLPESTPTLEHFWMQKKHTSVLTRKDIALGSVLGKDSVFDEEHPALFSPVFLAAFSIREQLMQNHVTKDLVIYQAAHALREMAIRSGNLPGVREESYEVKKEVAMEKFQEENPDRMLQASIAHVSMWAKDMCITCIGRATCTVEYEDGSFVVSGVGSERQGKSHTGFASGTYPKHEHIRTLDLPLMQNFRRIVLETHPQDTPGASLEILLDDAWRNLPKTESVSFRPIPRITAA